MRDIRILFIPEPASLRTSERTPALFSMLKENHDVVGLRAPWDRFLYDTDRAKWPRYLLYGFDKLLLGIRGFFLARRHRVDAVFCETAHPAIPGLWIARMLALRCIWDSHGHVGLFSRSLAKGWTFSHLSALLERFLGKRVDALITVSETDADAYSAMGVPKSRIHVIAVWIDLAAIGPARNLESVEGAGAKSTSVPPVLLFFGSFKYRPNREALEFINTAVAPFLARKGLRCEIRIAGRDIPELPFHPSVKPIGFVPDIHETIRAADLCLVPVTKGVGILTKVLDIMAVGTPLVLSAFAARAIPGVESDVHAFVASDPHEFPELVARALASPAVCGSMARRARQLVEERYDRELQRAFLEAALLGRTSNRGRSPRER